MKNLSEIIKSLAEGDKSALSELYDMYAPTIYGVTLRITESKERADKVIEKTFREIWKKASQYDPAAHDSFIWIMDIAKFIALEDEFRSDQFDFYAFQESNSSGQDLRDFFSHMDEKNIRLLELAYFRNLSGDRIEEEMNMPVGTVNTRLRIAMKSLRKILADHEIEA